MRAHRRRGVAVVRQAVQRPVERLEPRRLLSLSLLRDFNTITAASNANGLVVLGNLGYFGADDGTHGYELWQTDGSAGGTALLKDINPGGGGSIVTAPAAAGGLLYFSADDGAHGVTLWRSDGTAAGTVRLTNPVSGQFLIGNVVDLNGIAIFGTNSYGVWRSDGTVAGTSQIAAVNSANVARLGDEIYFFGPPSAGGAAALWKSDGTAAGTVMVRQFTGGGSSSINALDGRLYFWADDGAGAGMEPWASDGTAAGTVSLGDLAAGTSGSGLVNIAAFNGAVYFTATTVAGSDALTLFRTDRTANSATAIASLGNNGFTYDQPGLVVFNGAMYFRGWTAASGRELWRSDGTSAGTGPFLDLYPGNQNSNPAGFQLFDNRLYFAAVTPGDGNQLHSTDGTVAGTTLLKLSSGAFVTTSSRPSKFNGRLYFQGSDVPHGAELWSTDGTAGGTAMLSDLNTNTNSFNPSAFTLGPGGRYYFTGNDGLHGTDLWQTDGTAAGTSIVKDFHLIGASFVGPSVFVNGLLLFAARDTAGLELWRSDGTDAGTSRVIDLAPGSSSGLSDGALVKVGGRVFFAATSDTGSFQDYGVWVSDGTAAGTQLVRPGDSSFTSALFSGSALDGKFVFHARSSTDAGSIYITDGTVAGTTPIKSGFSDLPPNTWTLFSGKLYFAEVTRPTGRELWSTDGTTAGTAMVADIYAGSSSSNPDNFVATSDRLYFAADVPMYGHQLWQLDAATSTLSRLTTLSGGVQQVRPAAAGGVIFTNGNHLYRFDGTNLIRLDGAGATFSIAPKLLGSANGLDYFSAGTTAAGTELWMMDGTAAGTVMVQDLVPGPGSSLPQNFSVIDGSVYVSATTPAVGRELFVLPPFARLNADGSLTLEGTQSSDALSLDAAGGSVAASLFGVTLLFPQSAVTNGVHVLGDGGATDTLNVGSGTFRIDDDLGTTAPQLIMSIASGADVTFGSTEHLEALSIAGLARVAPGGGNALVTKSLALQPGGSLDLADNPAIIDYSASSPRAMIESRVASGYAGGAWTGPGIRSSTAAAAAGTTVGIAESAQILGPTGGTFAGQPVDATAVLLVYTLAGDANLDRRVDVADFTILAANFNRSGRTFSQGNFDYDASGMVDLTDFTILAANFNKSLPPPGVSAARVAAAPAPLVGDAATTVFPSNAGNDGDLLDDSEPPLV